METHIQSVEDSLIESLSFKLPNSANFINDRRSVTFFPTGGNEFTPQGVKIIKFMIAGTDWLDPSTVRVQFRLTNADRGASLQLVSPLPAQFFRRLRIICGGQVVEDIDYYNRVYHMVHNLLPAERRLNDESEGFGVHQSVLSTVSLDYPKRVPPAIAQDGNRIVLFPLMCGLFNQTKFLPLKYLQGLQIELEVVNSFDEVCIFQPDVNLLPNPHNVDITDWAAAVGKSRRWVISEPQIKCDVITLDNQLDNEYTDHLMQGKSLPLNFSSFVHMVHAIGYTEKPTISLSRSFTRLKTVFATFYKTPLVVNYVPAGLFGGWGTYTEIPNMTATHLPLREFNFFYHPQYLYPGRSLVMPNSAGGILDNGLWTFCHRTEPELQLQVGAKLFPEIPMRSSAEMYYQLRKSLGSHQPGSQYAVNIVDREYRSTHFIVAFDTEKQTNAGFSGLNTRAGDLITIKGKDLKHVNNDGTALDTTKPEFLHVTLEYDAILTITDAGVTVLE